MGTMASTHPAQAQPYQTASPRACPTAAPRGVVLELAGGGGRRACSGHSAEGREQQASEASLPEAVAARRRGDTTHKKLQASCRSPQP